MGVVKKQRSINLRVKGILFYRKLHSEATGLNVSVVADQDVRCASSSIPKFHVSAKHLKIGGLANHLGPVFSQLVVVQIAFAQRGSLVGIDVCSARVDGHLQFGPWFADFQAAKDRTWVIVS